MTDVQLLQVKCEKDPLMCKREKSVCASVWQACVPASAAMGDHYSHHITAPFRNETAEVQRWVVTDDLWFYPALTFCQDCRFMAESGSDPDLLNLWNVLFFHQHLHFSPSKMPCTFRSAHPQMLACLQVPQDPFQWRGPGYEGVGEEMEQGVQEKRPQTPSSLQVSNPSFGPRKQWEENFKQNELKKSNDLILIGLCSVILHFSNFNSSVWISKVIEEKGRAGRCRAGGGGGGWGGHHCWHRHHGNCWRQKQECGEMKHKRGMLGHCHVLPQMSPQWQSWCPSCLACYQQAVLGDCLSCGKMLHLTSSNDW